ncbi:MAG: DJ-1/PfpI family protein [Candidatus Micrarchaeota archaeon]|nr:DJ-1/PfpI family protein [Candidatus Micrarchaeota archaeon]
MKKILMIIAPTNFRDEELLEPKEIFEKNGFQVDIASKGVSKAKGMLGTVIDVNLDVKNVKIDEYTAIVFVGGSGTVVYFNDKDILRIAKEGYEKGKVVGAICIAPSILANAGLLKGKMATSFPSEKDNLIDKGAKYTGEGVIVDGRIVTANGPKSAKRFGEEIIKLL